MLHSYFGLTHNFSQALRFNLEFENQSRSRVAIMGLEHTTYQQQHVIGRDKINYSSDMTISLCTTIMTTMRKMQIISE